MEEFFRTHTYLVEHTNAAVRRTLMDEINWNDRLIGIKGTRGIGKTTFLLQYAKEHFDVTDRKCLYGGRQGAAHRPGVQTPGMEPGTEKMPRPLPQPQDSVHGIKRDETQRGKPGAQRHCKKL